MTTYEPGLYAKGSNVQRADTPARAVTLVFNGYKRVADETVENTSYPDLQGQAKALGVPANQKAETLLSEIQNFENEGGTPPQEDQQ